MAPKKVAFTMDYDAIADIMVFRVAGFSGNTFTREHPEEEMVNIILDESTEKSIGMIITEYNLFLCKYAPQEKRVRIRREVRKIIPEDRFLRERYDQLVPARA